jgi:hypothetical protein
MKEEPRISPEFYILSTETLPNVEEVVGRTPIRCDKSTFYGWEVWHRWDCVVREEYVGNYQW